MPSSVYNSAPSTTYSWKPDSSFSGCRGAPCNRALSFNERHVTWKQIHWGFKEQIILNQLDSRVAPHSMDGQQWGWRVACPKTQSRGSCCFPCCKPCVPLLSGILTVQGSLVQTLEEEREILKWQRFNFKLSTFSCRYVITFKSTWNCFAWVPNASKNESQQNLLGP